MKFVRVLLVLFLLIGCSIQEADQTQVSITSTTTTTTTTPAVTTKVTTTVTTTTPITMVVTTTTTAPVITATTTTIEKDISSVLSPVTSDYLLRMIEDKETFYAYLGTTTCPHCQVYKPVVEQVVSIIPNIDFFYVMLDTDTGKRQGELLDLLGLEFIPLTIQVVNGEVVDQYVGEMDVDQLIEFMN